MPDGWLTAPRPGTALAAVLAAALGAAAPQGALAQALTPETPEVEPAELR